MKKCSRRGAASHLKPDQIAAICEDLKANPDATLREIAGRHNVTLHAVFHIGKRYGIRRPVILVKGMRFYGETKSPAIIAELRKPNPGTYTQIAHSVGTTRQTVQKLARRLGLSRPDKSQWIAKGRRAAIQAEGS